MALRRDHAFSRHQMRSPCACCYPIFSPVHARQPVGQCGTGSQVAGVDLAGQPGVRRQAGRRALRMPHREAGRRRIAEPVCFNVGGNRLQPLTQDGLDSRLPARRDGDRFPQSGGMLQAALGEPAAELFVGLERFLEFFQRRQFGLGLMQ